MVAAATMKPNASAPPAVSAPSSNLSLPGAADGLAARIGRKRAVVGCSVAHGPWPMALVDADAL